jgi:tRNA threonylcarbamoyladenosine biosynthesis protein TsaE
MKRKTLSHSKAGRPTASAHGSYQRARNAEKDPRERPGALPSVIRSRSEEETRAAATALARRFQGDEVVFLIGELGAGKTVFAKGIAAGLGLADIGEVCSPTFTLMNVYQARVPIYHLDLYRLANTPEIRDLGFEDYVGDGVIVVEWAEKIDFPMPAIKVRIDVGADDMRTISIER